MKSNHSSSHRQGCAHDAETRAQLGIRLRSARSRMGWSLADAAKFFQVTERTWHNWESGAHRIPFAVFKLARVLARFELPSPAWHGWRFEAGHLITPEGRQISPQDGSWWSLLIRQAAGFRDAYAEATRLRLALRDVTAKAAASGAVGAAAAAGLVPSKTSPCDGLTVDARCNQSDTIKTSCKPLLDYLTPSQSRPEAVPSTSESASMLSFASHWTPTCGVRLTFKPKPGPHLAGTNPHLKQARKRPQSLKPESSPEPKSKPSTSSARPNSGQASASSARPQPGAKPPGEASASGGAA